MKKTPLNEEHKSLGAKMVEFAGWEMPVQYKGVREEHDGVRNSVGLFDVSHMGEIRFKGPKSLETLQWLTSNDVSKIFPGKAQYSLLTNFDGGIVDDIIIYCLKENADYLVCVNAANIDKDFAWMVKNNKGAEITNESPDWAQIAVQGPKGLALGEKVFGPRVAQLKSFEFAEFDYNSDKVFVARTGYTGEAGFEVFVKNPSATKLWREFLDKGKEFEVQAIGLAARDTLRTEMKYSLYGHEITDETNPQEAGLGWVVKLKKGPFIGSDRIQKVQEQGTTRGLVGFKMVDKGIPRQGYLLKNSDNQEIGIVTSGTHSPTINEPIGIGYVTNGYLALGSEFFVEIRGKLVRVKTVKTPFVTPKSGT